MSPPLRHHSYTTDFLHLRVVWGAYTIKISCNLSPKICYANKLLQNVLGHNVSVTRFLSSGITPKVSLSKTSSSSKEIKNKIKINYFDVFCVHINVINSEI